MTDKTLEDWHQHGRDTEREFLIIAPAYDLPLVVHPDKESDKSAIDFKSSCGKYDVDLKTHETPFFMAKYDDMDPLYTVLVNVAQLARYRHQYRFDLTKLILIWWVKWTEQTRFNQTVAAHYGIYAQRLNRLLDSEGLYPIRKCQNVDKIIDNYLIDTRSLTKLEKQ